MKKIAHDPNELLAIVEECDKPIGKATRKEIHWKGLLHREVVVYIINSKKQLLLHKRADVHLWDHSSAGHFPFKDSYEQGALREVEEELGLKIKKQELLELAKERIERTSHGQVNNRFVKIFLIKKDIPLNDFKIDKEEVEEIKYFYIKELKKLLSGREISNACRFILEKYLLKELV